MRKGILAAALFVCGACGGGGSSNATVNGTISGQSMGAQDSVSNVLTSSSDSEGLILITNAANTCGKLTAGQQPRNAKAILIEIGTQTATAVSAPAASGTYTVHSSGTIGNFTGNVALALYAATDANCNPVSSIEASSGTVTLTRVDSTGYSGTFDITFSDASHVTGSFTAGKCTALSTNIQGTCT
jgi:hypothetical protein